MIEYDPLKPRGSRWLVNDIPGRRQHALDHLRRLGVADPQGRLDEIERSAMERLYGSVIPVISFHARAPRGKEFSVLTKDGSQMFLTADQCVHILRLTGRTQRSAIQLLHTLRSNVSKL